MPRSPILPGTDHSKTILAQLHREVASLKGQLTVPHTVIVGYLAATHRGRALVREGDEVEGLRVQIDRANPMTITVEGDARYGGTERVSTTW